MVDAIFTEKIVRRSEPGSREPSDLYLGVHLNLDEYYVEHIHDRLGLLGPELDCS